MGNLSVFDIYFILFTKNKAFSQSPLIKSPFSLVYIHFYNFQYMNYLFKWLFSAYLAMHFSQLPCALVLKKSKLSYIGFIVFSNCMTIFTKYCTIIILWIHVFKTEIWIIGLTEFKSSFLLAVPNHCRKTKVFP